MIILKVLGAIDLISALVFLLLIFGIHPFLQLTLFCSGLQMLKGMFILTGDVLSGFDIFCSVMLLISIFFTPFSVLLWICAFFLMAKGVVSFI